MGRTAGVKNGEGLGYYRPRISQAEGAVESFIKLHEQKFLDEEHQLTAKGKKYVEGKLRELGLFNIILFENYFKKGLVDYSDIEEIIDNEKA